MYIEYVYVIYKYIFNLHLHDSIDESASFLQDSLYGWEQPILN